MRIVDEWVLRCNESPEVWDQKILQKVISDLEVRVGVLPDSYVYISKMDTGMPAIIHNQASRRLKNRYVNVAGIPTEVFGVKVRQLGIDVFGLPRVNGKIEQYLDENYHRVRGKKNIWSVRRSQSK